MGCRGAGPWGLPRSGAIPDSILHRSKQPERRVSGGGSKPLPHPRWLARQQPQEQSRPQMGKAEGDGPLAGVIPQGTSRTLSDQESPSHHPKAGRMTLPQPLPTKTRSLSTHGGKEALSKPVLATVSRSLQNTPCRVQAGGTCGWQGPTATMASWGGQSLPAPCHEDSSS